MLSKALRAIHGRRMASPLQDLILANAEESPIQDLMLASAEESPLQDLGTESSGAPPVQTLSRQDRHFELLAIERRGDAMRRPPKRAFAQHFVLLLSTLALSAFTAANAAEEITTFSKELLTKYVGKSVSMKGRYTERTKLAHAILSPWGEVVYFEPRTSKTKSKVSAQTAKAFNSLKEGDHIIASGKLFKYTPEKPVREDVASIPEHFYLDEYNVKINQVK